MIFKEKGLQGASLGDVAEALGTDRASLYYYVSGRQELFNEVIREACEANVSEAEAIHNGEGTASEKISMLITGLMSSYAENFPFLYVYIQEDLNRIDDGSEWAHYVHQISRRYNEAVIGIIEQGIAQGTFKAHSSPRTLAFGIIGMVNWTHRWFDPTHDGPNAQEIGNSFVQIALEGMHA